MEVTAFSYRGDSNELLLYVTKSISMPDNKLDVLSIRTAESVSVTDHFTLLSHEFKIKSL